MTPHTIPLFGLPIENVTLDAATDELLASALAGQRRIIYFVNAHCVNIAVHHAEYLRILPTADRLYADGSGLALAARLAGTPLISNVNGTDMFPVLCERAARTGLPIALLGTRPEIIKQCAENMQRRFPGLNIAFLRDGFFKPEEEPEVIRQINTSGARVLLVALGVPGQELWIARCAAKLETPVIMGVGGLFDFYSGLRKRAPWLLRKTGLEWTFRLAQEPRRLFKRYIFGNPIFIARTLRLRLGGREKIRHEMGASARK